MKFEFTKYLLKWNRRRNKRSMPWKGESDPYKIWLSEVILQQTRVEQGLKYYNTFIAAFPTIQALASAPLSKLYKLWEGLGYYNRCRNLHETARFICQHYNSRFPDKYADIRKLKGIGPYTAAAISSFAFNLPYAVVDGNVQRVISRYFGINTPVDTPKGRKIYELLAEKLLDPKYPGIYNQAIMDFGATVCKPKQPLCENCVQKNECQAFQHGWTNLLPVKDKKLKRKERWFNYYILNSAGKLYIRQRTEKDIWLNLYEFVLHETPGPVTQQANSLKFLNDLFPAIAFEISSVSKNFSQQLTHQTIHGRFIRVNCRIKMKPEGKYFSITKKELQKYPFPKLINQYLEQELI